MLVTEYARHKAWRARSILDCLMNENEWIDDEQHFIEVRSSLLLCVWPGRGVGMARDRSFLLNEATNERINEAMK